MKHQSKPGSSYRPAAKPGVTIRGSSSRLAPASRTTTLTVGSSVRRDATARPDIPPQTAIKSNFSVLRNPVALGSPRGVDILVGKLVWMNVLQE